MPDKPVTVVAYAAGASLAAITLFYVFGPTFFIDGENSYNTSDGRKRGIIGLSNPANDCFINSVLQALAGLGDLRLYLIRELHRRKLDGPEVYEQVLVDLKKGEKPDKIRDLQQGPVTRALKEMLDALNERPIYKKTISARPMIEALEKAFRTRISRNQQDAQEFFQVVAERLCDEYHAAAKARKASASVAKQSSSAEEVEEDTADQYEKSVEESAIAVKNEADLTNLMTREKPGLLEMDDGFPFEGKIESQIRCLSCGFKNKPSSSNFVSLTLNVPQKSSTTLDHCFDVLLKTEDIEDFKCDKCRLTHALEWKRKALGKSRSEKEQASLEDDIELIQRALEEDPENAPQDVDLPPSDEAPKRKIRKHMYITTFPKIVAIHLSRSVFDPRSYSTKNMAKVSYPERLRLGGLLDEKWYKLLGIVCHKGSHNSGHYESFRRNHLYPPFATPDAFSAYAAASRTGSVAPSAGPSPRIPALAHNRDLPSTPSIPSTPSVSSTSLSQSISRPSSRSTQDQYNGVAPTSAPRSSPQEQSRPSTRLSTTQPPVSPAKNRSKSQLNLDPVAKFRRKKRSNDRWWRISDDKIKECKTADVLAMQREVYLLFYELERPGDDTTS
jgi:ubiquitin carboxyl-terminal hydrolase 16